MQVSEVKDDGLDAAGARIIDVYARRPPQYAVYRTEQRVMIHFADDPDEAKAQGGLLAPINPVRGEINGLVDGWRADAKRPKSVAKASRYDRRIADALVVGLENDVPGSRHVLDGIRADIIDERTSWARFEYLAAALVVSGILILIVWAILELAMPKPDLNSPAPLLWFSIAGGTIGAFFSIAITIRKRTVLTDLHTRDNIADAALRVVVGAIAAGVLVSLVKLGAIGFSIGNAAPKGDETDWLYYLLVAFAAGFSEQLIPDLLEKSAPTAAEAAVSLSPSRTQSGPSSIPPPAPVPLSASAMPAAPAPPTALAPPAVLAAPPAEDTGALQKIRNDLQTARQVVGALQGLGVGSKVLANADGLAGSADKILAAVDQVIERGGNAATVAGVAAAATPLLDQLANAGVPGVVGGAASVLGNAIKLAGPAIAGLPGGPVGVVAGLVMGGLQVLGDEQKFNAWKTALLAKPFDRSLLPASVDGTTARLALELSPLMSKRLENTSQQVATELLRACITPAADGNPRNSSDLAHELMSSADPLGLKNRFASEAELSEALEEYRASAIFIQAQDQLSGKIAIPALAGAQSGSVDMGTLLTAAFKMRQDPRAGEALEKIVFLVQALGALHLDPGKLASLAVNGLEAGAAIARNSRTIEDPHNVPA